MHIVVQIQAPGAASVVLSIPSARGVCGSETLEIGVRGLTKILPVASSTNSIPLDLLRLLMPRYFVSLPAASASISKLNPEAPLDPEGDFRIDGRLVEVSCMHETSVTDSATQKS